MKLVYIPYTTPFFEKSFNLHDNISVYLDDNLYYYALVY